jgi:hypothetical protein
VFELILRRFGIEAGAFLSGKRIQVPANTLDILRDLPGSSPLCSLEKHVLDKMRNTA